MIDTNAVFKGFAGQKIAVIGDLMLDVYLFGQVSRVSPEAPVPIVNVLRRTSCLGGAGNVIRNLANLGAVPLTFGAIGNDDSGKELCSLLTSFGGSIDGVVTDTTRRTTEKRRVIAGSQQLLREDFEDVAPLSDTIRSWIVEQVCADLKRGKINAVIFEDYAKGVLSAEMLEAIIAEAHRCGAVTSLDPKPRGVANVRGLTVIKPNRSEAFALSGIADPGANCPPAQDPALAAAAKKLFADWQAEQLLISLAAQGIALFKSSGELPSVIPTRAREVFDVSGAGDTVIATYTLGLATGLPPVQAAEIANLAAGVVVSKVGTAPIEKDALISAINEFNEEKKWK